MMVVRADGGGTRTEDTTASDAAHERAPSNGGSGRAHGQI